MNLVSRGLGVIGGLLVSNGLGAISQENNIIDHGGGAKMIYQVSHQKIAIRPKKTLNDISELLLDDVNIKIKDTDFAISGTQKKSISEIIKSHSQTPQIIKLIAKEHAVSNRKARSMLRTRVNKEIKALEGLKRDNINDDDLLEILIITGVI